MPQRVVHHLKDVSKHDIYKWQLSNHLKGLVCIEETAEVPTAAAAQTYNRFGFSVNFFVTNFVTRTNNSLTPNKALFTTNVSVLLVPLLKMCKYL